MCAPTVCACTMIIIRSWNSSINRITNDNASIDDDRPDAVLLLICSCFCYALHYCLFVLLLIVMIISFHGSQIITTTAAARAIHIVLQVKSQIQIYLRLIVVVILSNRRMVQHTCVIILILQRQIILLLL